MRNAWDVLRDAGLPLAGSRRGTPSASELHTALSSAIAERESASSRQRDALAAFVLAWAHEWPSSFRDAFAEHGAVYEAWASTHFEDLNRRIKLRRIAIENLAKTL